MSSGDTFEARSSAARAARVKERGGRPGRDACRDRTQLLEQDRVADGARPTGLDEDEVPGHVGPQAQDHLDPAPALRGWRPGRCRDGVVVGIGRGVGIGRVRRGRPVRDRVDRGRGQDRGRAAPARPASRTGDRVGLGQGGSQGDRPRDSGPRGRKSGRRPGVGQVQQDPRQLGADEDRLGSAGIGEGQSRPASRQASEAGGRRRVREAMVGHDPFDVARADQPETDSETARPHGRQQARLLVRAEHDRHAGRRFLERLEQGRLGVLVHPIRALDDRHPGAALDRHEEELADEVLDAAELRVRPADDDLATRSDRPEPMHVGMAAALDQPAGTARPARSGGRGGRAQQPGRDVQREVVLPTPSGPTRSTAWGAGPRIIAATASSAAACPRVRAPSMTAVRRGRSTPSCAWSAALARHRTAWRRRSG